MYIYTGVIITLASLFPLVSPTMHLYLSHFHLSHSPFFFELFYYKFYF